jgi:hypothetical protein
MPSLNGLREEAGMDADVLAHDIAVDRDKLNLLYERQKRAEAEKDARKVAAITRRIIRVSERITRRTDELKTAETRHGS